MIEYTLIAGLVGFYIINLALGLYQGRNVRTAHTYVFGHRYSTGVLLMTLTGTLIGADYLTYFLYDGPKIAVAVLFLYLPCFFITGLVAAYYFFPKLRAFKNWYTLGDIVGQAYGSKYAQLAVEGISVISSVILLAAQLVALKRVGTLLGIGKDASLAPYLLVISFALVVIAYASRSGAPGIVSTDVLQMILVLGGTSFITYRLLNLDLGNVHVQGLKDLWDQVILQLDENARRFLFLYQDPAFTRRVLSGTTYGLLLFSPAFIKRIGMASDNRQLKHSMIGFITAFGLFIFIILSCSFGLFIVHGGKLGHNDVFLTLLKVVSNQLWAKLLLLIMFLAAVMSTSDSILTASSVCALRLMMSLKANEQHASKPSLGKLRLANVIIGLLALVLALLFMHYPLIEIVVFARSILGGLLPCLIGISLGIKKSSKALLGSMACFALLFIGSLILVEVVDFSFMDPKMVVGSTLSLRQKYKTFLPFVILLSVLVYILFEMMVHKGLKWESREHFTEAKPGMLKRWWLEAKKSLGSPVLWAEEKMDAYESRGVLLTLVCIVMFLTPQFVGIPLHSTYLKSMTMLMLLVFTLCVFNLFPEEWSQKLRRYYPLYWIISLLVCLPCASLLRWLYYPTLLNALYLMLTPFVMQFFIGHHLSVSLALLAYVLGFGAYRLTADASVMPDHAMFPLVGLLCNTILAWIGGGYHMRRRLKRANRPRLWASSWGHDLSHLFMEAQMETSLEYNPLPKEQKARLAEAEKRLQTMSKYIKHAITQAQSFRQLIVQDSIRSSEIESLPLTKMVRQVFDALPTHLQDLIHITGKAPIKVKVSMPLAQEVMMNLIRNPYQLGATKVVLDWDDKSPVLHIRDNGPGIAKEKIATVFETTSSRNGRSLGLPFVKEALAKMGALIDVQSSDEGTVFMILFDQEDGK